MYFGSLETRNHSFAGFKPLTQLSGPTAVVLNYNVLPGIIASLANRIFGAPAIWYFEDFGFIIPSTVSEIDIHLFVNSCILPGLNMEIRKLEIGASVVYLGMSGIARI